MAESAKTLGKLESTHGVQPALIQRAAVVAVLAFLFFLIMLIVFSIRQHFGYLLLAAAFLVVEIFTMLGLYAHRRNILQIFENGGCYKKQCFRWSEIVSFKSDKSGLKFVTSGGAAIAVPATHQNLQTATRLIAAKLDPATTPGLS